MTVSRRSFVGMVGIGTVVGLAGCLDDGGDDDDNEDETDTGTELGEITVENLNDETRTVDVIVEFDGEIEHWSTHDLEANGDGATLERDWPTDTGQFRVTVRLDEGEFTGVTPAEWNNPDCLNLVVLVQRGGEITIAGVTDGGPCGNGDVDLEEAETAAEDDA